MQLPRPCYAVGTGWGMAGGSGFPPFCSEMGVVGRISSLGSTMLTWSGRGFLGPILPLGSQGSMIFTLMPSTPCLMIHSGDPVNYYVDTAVRHVLLRQGVLGIKVKIMLPWDPSGKIGPKKPLPDHVSIVEPKDEILPTTPISEQKGGKPEPPAMPQPVPTA